MSNLKIDFIADNARCSDTGLGRKTKNMTGKIIGLFISIGLIIAGLSGEFVLKGTDSGIALVIAGLIYLIWDIISIVRYRNKQKENKNLSE